jgi:glutamate synthase (NADPH/NADH) large chain
LLHTGSARAKAMLADWNNAVSKFVKVMPVDYARALTDMKNERAKSAAVAAE